MQPLTSAFWVSLGNLYLLALPSLAIATSQYTSSMSVQSVVVVGGTHGNEYTGVWCIKALDRQLKVKNEYPSLHLSTLLGNPQAHMANKRFVDEDLNRQFSYKALKESPSGSVESQRAQELDQLLGPKFSDNPAVDLLIDLHTTTSNMGTTLIVAEGDPLMTQAAAYVLHKCPEDNICVLMHTHKNQRERPHLSSIAPHAFSIEVGAVPQGVVRHDGVRKTQRALAAALEFMERHNTQPEELYRELQVRYPSGRVPCYRSAPAQLKGEISGKIPWPSDVDNKNFPTWMVHNSVQDQDFQEIRTGDPLFVNLDGNVIKYDGSFGSPILLMFINEGGYYYSSSGTGISVARRDEYNLETGELSPEEKQTEL